MPDLPRLGMVLYLLPDWLQWNRYPRDSIDAQRRADISDTSHIHGLISCCNSFLHRWVVYLVIENFHFHHSATQLDERVATYNYIDLAGSHASSSHFLPVHARDRSSRLRELQDLALLINSHLFRRTALGVVSWLVCAGGIYLVRLVS
jgi:hypothetical protein